MIRQEEEFNLYLIVLHSIWAKCIVGRFREDGGGGSPGKLVTSAEWLIIGGLYIYIIFILNHSYIWHVCPRGAAQYFLRLYQWHDYEETELYNKSSGCNIKSAGVSDNLADNSEGSLGIQLIKKSVCDFCAESCSPSLSLWLGLSTRLLGTQNVMWKLNILCD